MIKIAYVEKAAGAAKPSRLEMQLAEQGRAEVYGIYFDFSSDAIRPESEPVYDSGADRPDPRAFAPKRSYFF